VIYAGAPTPVPLLKRALDCFGYIFVQGYGLTETGPSGTVLTAEEHRQAVENGKEHILASVGREMLYCDVRVVDDAGRRLPVNEIGEVTIRSTSVMKAYWGNPEATSQALKQGWFYTGDMGWFDDEGYLYLADRKKDMIISGGENVYPSEVEKILFQHPSVADCTIIGLPDPEWGEKVTAVVVLQPGEQENPEQLTQFCRASLAGYKCPKVVHFVEDLPRNPSGKVLKNDLRRELVGDG
jgi:acyl-CoA synthetase (AMP-forming)/AMP-acid ligase II